MDRVCASRLFNPNGKGNENELTQWRQNEFSSQSQCYRFLNDNYVKIDTTLHQHAKERGGRVIIIGCGEKESSPRHLWSMISGIREVRIHDHMETSSSNTYCLCIQTR